MSDDERITADGVTVKVGDIAWRDAGWGAIRATELTKHDISWWKHYADQWFASEAACVAAAIGRTKQKVKRAVRDLKRERERVEKLKARLRAIGARR